jgi:hypothetical protein
MRETVSWEAWFLDMLDAKAYGETEKQEPIFISEDFPNFHGEPLKISIKMAR